MPSGTRAWTDVLRHAGPPRAAKVQDAERTIAKTILLVEDEETVRRVTGRLLAKLGYDVLSAADAQEALDVFDAKGDEIDLVLTDIVMPGLTGVEMAELLRRKRPGLRVLFMSGYASRDLGRELQSPPEPFLPKPFSLQQLAASIERALEEGAGTTP